MGGNAIANTPHLWIRRAWTRLWILLLCGTLTAQPVWSQNANAPANTGSGPSQSGPGSAPDRLQIKVLSPVPMTEPAGALSANQVAVQVVDGWGMPVARAAVSFRLPEAGPGGVFLNGLGTEVVITDEQGKASVQGFDWRAETGTSFLHVIAAYGSIRTGAMVEVQLGRRVSELPPAATVAPPKRALNPPPPQAPPASAAPPAPSASAAFPLPPEATAQPTPTTTAPGMESRQPAREAYVKPLPKAPRAMEPGEAPPAYANAVATVIPAPRKPQEATSDAAEDETASYVTVKKRSGGSKTLLFLVVAAAAAGGALAAGMAGGGSSGSSSVPSTPGTPTISIGSPSISVSGGTN